VNDAFFQKYAMELRTLIEQYKEGLCGIPPDKLQFMQGQIAGLRQAVNVLEGVLEEQDR
jgi:hypothetical protein